jgi:hypothetical protein
VKFPLLKKYQRLSAKGIHSASLVSEELGVYLVELEQDLISVRGEIHSEQKRFDFRTVDFLLSCLPFSTHKWGEYIAKT